MNIYLEVTRLSEPSYSLSRYENDEQAVRLSCAHGRADLGIYRLWFDKTSQQPVLSRVACDQSVEDRLRSLEEQVRILNQLKGHQP